MIKISRFLFPLLFILLSGLQAFPLKPEKVNLLAHPPRIIRTCCMFGTRVGVFGIPFLRLSAITSMEKMGQHLFLGGSSENNGVVYTRRGGFIDMGHLRDNADWAAWLYSLLEGNRGDTLIERSLGNEGGEKRLRVVLPPDASDEDLVLLAGRIAYDLGVWHEIATWYGVSSMPLVSEQFSSFSVEDTYSNLQGVLLGMEAIRSDLPYDEAMTTLVAARLRELEVVASEEETVAAMEKVRDVWWTRAKRYPSSKVVMLRNTHPYEPVYPFLIDYRQESPEPNPPLIVPAVNTVCDSLSLFYTFSVRINYKFPVKRLFPVEANNRVTQHDFPRFLQDINAEYATGFLVPRKLRVLSEENGPDKTREKKKERKERKQKKETGMVL